MDMQCSQCGGTKLVDVSYMDAYFEGTIYMCLECGEFIFVEKHN